MRFLLLLRVLEEEVKPDKNKGREKRKNEARERLVLSDVAKKEQNQERNRERKKSEEKVCLVL